MSSLTLLGTGTCQIEHERRASSVLLELDGTHILFDCGHGIVQRLLEVGVEHNQLQHIVFSHFHADHISDIIPFLQAGAFSRRNSRTSGGHIYRPGGGKGYAITGDSYFHAEEIAFLRDVDLAVIDSGHITDEEIVQLAVASQVKTMLCSHLYREIDARHLQTLAEQQGYEGTILVG